MTSFRGVPFPVAMVLAVLACAGCGPGNRQDGPPLRYLIRLDPAIASPGDTVEVEHRFQNATDEPLRIAWYRPWLIFPEIRDAEGRRIDYIVPRSAGRRTKKAVTVLPGTNRRLVSSRIVLRRAEEGEDVFDGAFVPLEPGTYTVRYRVTLPRPEGETWPRRQVSEVRTLVVEPAASPGPETR